MSFFLLKQVTSFMGGKDWGSAAETGWKAACGEWDACFQANGVHVGMGGEGG